MKPNFNEKIINRIREKNIFPKPKIFFILKNISFWFFSILSILIGAISFATILHNISDKKELFQNFSYLPIFWIFILIIFLIISINNYRKTNNFYKYNIYFIFIIIIIFSFILGVLMFSFGVGEKTEQLSQKYLPFYEKHQRITDLKKEIFKDKLIEIGVTSEIIKENPKLKEKIDKKFRENVLGKTYLYSPEKCLEIEYTCPKNSIPFLDNLGCGCRTIYLIK